MKARCCGSPDAWSAARLPYPGVVASTSEHTGSTATPIRWLSAEEQRAWRALLAVESRLNERLDQELREGHGVTLAEYAVLVHLGEMEPSGLRMSDLAGRLLISRSGLTRRIDSLVSAGLVTRRSCPADRRGSMAQLTPAGIARLEEAAPTHVAGVRRYLIDALGDLSGLEAGLAAINSALDRSC